MALRYLDFEYSEDPEGNGLFDAMASVRLDQLPAVRAEVAVVLDWARVHFGANQGPLDEGGDWDEDLSEVLETTASGAVRHTLSLSLSGTPGFCAAFGEHFGLDAA